jgi:GrpB-like predicted nucleotidyltransferase (UPF0157 family)
VSFAGNLHHLLKRNMDRIINYRKHVGKGPQFAFIFIPIENAVGHFFRHTHNSNFEPYHIHVYYTTGDRNFNTDLFRRDARSRGNTLQAALERLQLLDKEEFLGAVNFFFGFIFVAI